MIVHHVLPFDKESTTTRMDLSLITRRFARPRRARTARPRAPPRWSRSPEPTGRAARAPPVPASPPRAAAPPPKPSPAHSSSLVLVSLLRFSLLRHFRRFVPAHLHPVPLDDRDAVDHRPDEHRLSRRPRLLHRDPPDFGPRDPDARQLPLVRQLRRPRHRAPRARTSDVGGVTSVSPSAVTNATFMLGPSPTSPVSVSHRPYSARFSRACSITSALGR